MRKILVVDDEKEMAQTICRFLDQNGYDAKACTSANDAYNEMYGEIYDMVITDVMMPGTDGFAFAETLRSVNKDIPIMFLTARDDFEAKQKGFRIGIDDYMTKPVDLKEMLLRIEAILRRANIASDQRLEIGTLIMDAQEHSAYVNDEEVPLTSREFNILFKLLSYPKKTFTRSQLMEEFWDADTASGPRVVDVYITKLRDKLSACDSFEIVTVHGMGYKAIIK